MLKWVFYYTRSRLFLSSAFSPFKSLLFFLLMSSLIAGCGFMPRSGDELPALFRVMYLDLENPDSSLSAQLKRRLKAAHVQCVNSSSQALTLLHIHNVQWIYNPPPILFSGYAVTYTYTIHVDFSVTTPQGKILLGPKQLTVTRHLTQNANQVYVPEAEPLMKKEMIRTLVNLIYSQLLLKNEPVQTPEKS